MRKGLIVNLNSKPIIEFLKYGFWGAITTGINLLLFFLLESLGLFYIVANILSYIFAVLVNYVLNKKYVFNNRISEKKTSIQLMNFFFIRISSLIIDNILFFLLVSKLHYNVNMSRVSLSFFIIVATYGLNKLFVFNSKKR